MITIRPWPASRTLAAVGCLVATLLTHLPLPAGEPLVVGLARVDITPTGPIRLNGFAARGGESRGVRQPIAAKAIAIGGGNDGSAPVVVITVETLGIPEALSERLAARLAPHGIPRARLALCATHTHSSPMIRDCANTLFGEPIPTDEWARVLAYSADLEAKLEQVALAALADRRPATLARATGRLDFAFNRRTPGGPVDHDLPLLVIREPDGSLRGLLATYACHCVTLADPLVSGDWAGYAMHHLERRHPGCLAMVSIGCGADANPRGGVVGGDAEVADILGREMADEIDRLLDTDPEPVDAAPRATFDRISLPLAELPDRAGWEARAGEAGAIGHHARVQLERIDRGETLATEIRYPIQTIAFGDSLAWVFLSGEVVVDYARRLERELDGKRLVIHAYANACPGYVPSERILAEGGYEGGQAQIYYDLPGPYAPGLEDRIVAAVHRRLGDRFPAPSDTSRTGGVAPLEPSQARATLRVPPGFHVELVAAEPMIESPVALAFGPDGRIWVAEMADYPSGTPDGRPGGRIRRLEDVDGDGLPDRSTIFLDGIPFPTGVTPWRDGVLVCTAPDILFARDTDGDGRADQREVIFTGFATHNFQARVNGLEFALDGGLEGSCGLFGGEITSLRHGTVTSLGARDFRIDPDAGTIEPAAGSSQQGRVRNDAGDWFGCTNSVPAIHFPLLEAWLRNNPDAAARRTAVPIVSSPGPGQLFPISTQVLFELSGPAGRSTAACGLGVYRDDLLATPEGGAFTGDLFTCEPVNNLVHHQRPVPDGVTFEGSRVAGEETREFLASTDPWFRPVQIRTGPDGALWVVDMYRYVIEHPIWIPEGTRARLDLRAGADRGRIYRIVPEGRALRPVPSLDRLPPSELVRAFDTPNGTVRDLVQQVLQWHGHADADTVAGLTHLAAESPIAAVRLQALATLANLGRVPGTLLRRAMSDGDPAVRRRGVRIVHAQGGMHDDETLTEAVIGLATDRAAAVRLEVAAAAAAIPPTKAARILIGLTEQDGGDDFFAAAIAGSLGTTIADDVIASLRERWRAEGALSPPLEALLGAAAATATPEAFAALLISARDAALAAPTAGEIERLAGLIAAGRRRADPPAPATDETPWIELIDVCRNLLADDGADRSLRAAAARLLGHGPWIGVPATESLLAALGPRSEPALRPEVWGALRTDGRAEVAGGILARWSTLAPTARQEALALLLERPSWIGPLLEAVRDGTVGPAEFDLPTRQSLLDHPDDVLRALAVAVLAPAPAGDRGALIGRHAAAIDRHGDPTRGGVVYRRHCAPCHSVAEVGYPVGPDISSHAGKPVEAFLVSLLDPHRAVDPRYEAYVVILDDGRSLTGTIGEETASGLTVLAAGGKREVIRRSAITELHGTGRSLMPEGFERELTPADVNDLWAWLGERRPAPKVLVGNAPAKTLVDGSTPTALPASRAEIRGGEIVFESQFGNVGHWHGDADSVCWAIEAAAAREVDVWGEWACAPGSAGNRLRIDGVIPPIVATVGSTGGWDRYALVRLGSAVLEPGAGTIVVRSEGALRGALVDLRAIHLVAGGESPTAVGPVEGAASGPPDPSGPPEAIAAWLLDAPPDAAAREGIIGALVTGQGADPAAVIGALVASLPEGDSQPEEYRRIPTLWSIAVAVGRQGDRDRWRRVLSMTLPADGDPLAHWQAVVIGGGLVNGAGLVGRWPGDDLSEALGDEPALAARWHRLLAQAAAMADDETVPDGTRYDALRIVALDTADSALPKLRRFLRPDVSAELQMGAVSGLADMRHDDATEALVGAVAWLSGTNLDLALDALVRTPERAQALLDALAEGTVPAALRGDRRVRGLVDHPAPEVAERARAILDDVR